MRDVDPSHGEKEPLLLYRACLVHAQRLFFATSVSTKFVQLFEAEQAGASEISGGIHTLEPNVNPLPRQSIVELLIRLERLPKSHEHLFMPRVLFTVLIDGGPGNLHLVVEPNLVNQLVNPVEVDWRVVNIADLEQLIDDNVCRGTVNLQQVHLHVVVLFGLLLLQSHQEAIKDGRLFVLHKCLFKVIPDWVTLTGVMPHEQERSHGRHCKNRNRHLVRILEHAVKVIHDPLLSK